MNPSWWILGWVLLGVVMVGLVTRLERKKLYPERLQSLERIEWLKSLPRTPDGRGYIVDRAGWEKHFPNPEGENS